MSDFLRSQPTAALLETIQQHLTTADALLSILHEREAGEPTTAPKADDVVSQALELGVAISFDYPTTGDEHSSWPRTIHPSSMGTPSEGGPGTVLGYDYDRHQPRRFSLEKMENVALAPVPGD